MKIRKIEKSSEMKKSDAAVKTDVKAGFALAGRVGLAPSVSFQRQIGTIAMCG